MGIKAFQNKLAKYKTVSFDTMLLIYFSDKNSHYFDLVYHLMMQAEIGKIECFVSIMVYLETLTSFYKTGDLTGIKTLQKIFILYSNIHFDEVDKKVTDKSAELRAKYNLKSPDAIILATAILNKARLFITNDIKIKQKFKEIEVICLKDYI